MAKYFSVHVELPQSAQEEEPLTRCLGDNIGVMGPAPVLTDVDTKEPDLLTLSTVVLLMEMESVSCNLLFPPV